MEWHLSGVHGDVLTPTIRCINLLTCKNVFGRMYVLCPMLCDWFSIDIKLNLMMCIIIYLYFWCFIVIQFKFDCILCSTTNVHCWHYFSFFFLFLFSYKTWNKWHFAKVPDFLRLLSFTVFIVLNSWHSNWLGWLGTVRFVSYSDSGPALKCVGWTCSEVWSGVALLWSVEWTDPALKCGVDWPCSEVWGVFLFKFSSAKWGSYWLFSAS